MQEHGGTPNGWHQRWRADARLQNSDAGVSNHELCCRILQDLCCYNQCNTGNLAAAEHCARQIQLVEERWKSRILGNVEQAEATQDSYLYARTATRGCLCIHPELQAWIAGELSKEYAVAKERRKAREERSLAKPKRGAEDK